jgi:hypothetical protein
MRKRIAKFIEEVKKAKEDFSKIASGHDAMLIRDIAVMGTMGSYSGFLSSRIYLLDRPRDTDLRKPLMINRKHYKGDHSLIYGCSYTSFYSGQMVGEPATIGSLVREAIEQFVVEKRKEQALKEEDLLQTKLLQFFPEWAGTLLCKTLGSNVRDLNYVSNITWWELRRVYDVVGKVGWPYVVSTLSGKHNASSIKEWIDNITEQLMTAPGKELYVVKGLARIVALEDNVNIPFDIVELAKSIPLVMVGRFSKVMMASIIANIRGEGAIKASSIKEDVDSIKRMGVTEDDYLFDIRYAVRWGYYGFTRYPKALHVKKLPVSLIKNLKKNFKFFLRIMKETDTKEEHTTKAAARIAICFGNRAEAWIKSDGDDIDDYSVHDAGIGLPDDKPSDDVVDWAFRNRKADKGILGNIMKRSSSLWEKYNINWKKAKLKEILQIMTLEVYDNVVSQEFAQECANWSIAPENFEEYQSRWLSALKGATSESIPYVRISEGEFTMYRLYKDDPRGLFLGKHTKCCQYPDGEASSSAWHGVENKDGAFFVVERRGTILAQSWTWRKGDTVVFDNVEALSNNSHDIIARLYREVAENIVGRFGINRVVVGDGYDDLGVEKYFPEPALHTVAPSGTYSDADNQWLIASK